MGTRRARIAVPAYTPAAGRVRSRAGGGFSVPEHYIHALHRAGAVPYMISAFEERHPSEIIADFDGIMLIGGGDVDPALYGADPHSALYDLERDRDVFEIGLLHATIEADKPVLAICRGLQVVNVAFNGTLLQHLEDVPALHPHRNRAGDRVFHDIAVTEDSQLESIAGPVLTNCSSRHHQAVDVIGEGLRVAARAPDGTIEALESDSPRSWLLGVQWHPEETALQDAAQQRLFDFLVAAASRRRAGQSATPPT